MYSSVGSTGLWFGYRPSQVFSNKTLDIHCRRSSQENLRLLLKKTRTSVTSVSDPVAGCCSLSHAFPLTINLKAAQ